MTSRITPLCCPALLCALLAACDGEAEPAPDAGPPSEQGTRDAQVADAQTPIDYFPSGPLCEDEVAHPPVSGDGICSPPVPSLDASSLDLAQVNLTLRIGGARVVVFDRVADLAACADLQAWYYDDARNPTQLVLCPEPCSLAGSDPDTQVQAVTGCETRCSKAGPGCAAVAP